MLQGLVGLFPSARFLTGIRSSPGPAPVCPPGFAIWAALITSFLLLFPRTPPPSARSPQARLLPNAFCPPFADLPRFLSKTSPERSYLGLRRRLGGTNILSPSLCSLPALMPMLLTNQFCLNALKIHLSSVEASHAAGFGCGGDLRAAPSVLCPPSGKRKRATVALKQRLDAIFPPLPPSLSLFF